MRKTPGGSYFADRGFPFWKAGGEFYNYQQILSEIKRYAIRVRQANKTAMV